MELINFGCSLFWKGNMNKQANIWCIIPAHNEVQGIEKNYHGLIYSISTSKYLGSGG